MAIRAVLTGDIVNSTKLSAAKSAALGRKLQALFAKEAVVFEFYRGDSFQAYVKDPAQALQLALLSRTAAIKLSKDDKQVLSDVRISIGIGAVTTAVRSLKTAKGEAFVLSGRKFDEMIKEQQRLAITSTNDLANLALQMMANYLNAIFKDMTGKQAEVIFELLKGGLQKEVASKIKKTKSTIHQRITAGRWPEIEILLQQYQQIILQLT